MEARIVDGPIPSLLDAEIECSKRGYGKHKTDAFISGVLKACFKAPVVEEGARRAGWIAEGETWAVEEMERRASKGAL